MELKCKRQVKSWRGHNIQLSGLTQLPGEVRPPRMSGCEWYLETIKLVDGETEAGEAEWLTKVTKCISGQSAGRSLGLP